MHIRNHDVFLFGFIGASASLLCLIDNDLTTTSYNTQRYQYHFKVNRSSKRANFRKNKMLCCPYFLQFKRIRWQITEIKSKVET